MSWNVKIVKYSQIEIWVQITPRCHVSSLRLAKMKTFDNTQYRWRNVETGTIIPSWDSVHWKAIWQYSSKLKLNTSSDKLKHMPKICTKLLFAVSFLPGVVQLQCMGQIWPADCFINKVYWHTATPSHLHTVSGCFWTINTKAELSSCNKAHNIYYLALYRESLLTQFIQKAQNNLY